jgi:hypothetical protein
MLRVKKKTSSGSAYHCDASRASLDVGMLQYSAALKTGGPVTRTYKHLPRENLHENPSHASRGVAEQSITSHSLVVLAAAVVVGGGCSRAAGRNATCIKYCEPT